MGISRKRRLEALEMQAPTNPWEVPPARSRAIRRLRLEDPHAIELLQGAFLRHERLGGPPVLEDGYLDLSDFSDEELQALGRLIELEKEEEAHRESL